MIEFSPVLAFAVLVVVALAFIPRRYWYVQLPAVLGWVLIWFDGEFTGALDRLPRACGDRLQPAVAGGHRATSQ